jgi:hypothetical protein
MPKERKDPILTLKNGAKANATHALMMRDVLEMLLRVHPAEFATLLETCRSDADGKTPRPALSKAAIKCLNDCGALEPDSTVRPLARDVLLSSYHVAPDGPVLTQPFALATAEEKRAADGILEDADRRNERRLKFLRRNDGDRESPSR